MSKRNKHITGVLGIGILLVSWFFIGVYEEREWQETYLFLKHRPTHRIFFYSPLGEADRSSVPGREGYLTPEQEKDEQAYNEFVEKHKGYKRSFPLPWL